MLYVLYVVCQGPRQKPSVRLVNEEGALAHSAPDVPMALRWLWGQGEEQVVAMTDEGPELFLIERCDAPALRSPSLSLRRAHAGGCCDLPPLLGLDRGPATRPRGLEDRPETPGERRLHRPYWLRRATSLPADSQAVAPGPECGSPELVTK